LGILDSFKTYGAHKEFHWNTFPFTEMAFIFLPSSDIYISLSAITFFRHRAKTQKKVVFFKSKNRAYFSDSGRHIVPWPTEE
jgi:hypothetical protein